MGNMREKTRVAVYMRLGRPEGAALYCRAALADDGAIAAQESLLKACADASGYKDDGIRVVYRDNGVSGLSMDRPGMNRLMEDIRADKIRMVIVADLSRVSRDYTHVMEWNRLLKKHGVKFISVSGGIR